MVKLTEEQKRQLEALDKIPDDEIDFSDIPPITDWSGFRMGLFYHPKWRDFSLTLHEYVLGFLERSRADDQALDEAVNKALRAQMYRMRFPVRVQKAEKTILRVQESPEEVAGLSERQIQEIEILYAKPIAEVASSDIPFTPVKRSKSGAPRSRVMKDVCLQLDENVIDWFEYGMEDGQSLNDVLNDALSNHINWIRSPRGVQREGEIPLQSGGAA